MLNLIDCIETIQSRGWQISS